MPSHDQAARRAQPPAESPARPRVHDNTSAPGLAQQADRAATADDRRTRFLRALLRALSAWVT
jgi:hypothetical protein